MLVEWLDQQFFGDTTTECDASARVTDDHTFAAMVDYIAEIHGGREMVRRMMSLGLRVG